MYGLSHYLWWISKIVQGGYEVGLTETEEQFQGVAKDLDIGKRTIHLITQPTAAAEWIN